MYITGIWPRYKILYFNRLCEFLKVFINYVLYLYNSQCVSDQIEFYIDTKKNIFNFI